MTVGPRGRLDPAAGVLPARRRRPRGVRLRPGAADAETPGHWLKVWVEVGRYAGLGTTSFFLLLFADCCFPDLCDSINLSSFLSLHIGSPYAKI